MLNGYINNSLDFNNYKYIKQSLDLKKVPDITLIINKYNLYSISKVKIF